MNQQIRELAKSVQCERHWTEEDIEKFAELILKKCMEMFEDAKVNQEDDVDYGLEEVKNIIKEHFGVES